MRRALPLMGLVLGALLVLPAVAKEGDTFRPFVSYTHYYDSNLYRLDEGEPIVPNGVLVTNPQRADQYSVLSAGLNVDWKPGRQQVIASASKNWARFDRYSDLDYDGSDYQATWNWRLGNRLSGNLGATESLTQSSFDSVKVGNLVTRKRHFGRAEWEFHPRWRIGGGVVAVDNTNSDPSLISQDFEQQVHDVAVSYRTPKGSNLRAQVRRVDALFPNPKILQYFFFPLPPYPIIPTAVADNSYKQTEYNLLGDWRVSGKLALRGQAGWVDRSYNNVLRNDFNGFATLVPRPDFSGYAGRISADWYATGKTLLSVSAYQELGDASDINASTVLKNGVNVNGMWLVREKWRMNAGATYENRDFRGDPGTLQRNDDTLGGSISLSYTPIRFVSLAVGVSAGRRDSNISVEEYKFHSLFANVRADF